MASYYDEEAGLLGGAKDNYSFEFAERQVRQGFMRKVLGEFCSYGRPDVGAPAPLVPPRGGMLPRKNQWRCATIWTDGEGLGAGLTRALRGCIATLSVRAHLEPLTRTHVYVYCFEVERLD